MPHDLPIFGDPAAHRAAPLSEETVNQLNDCTRELIDVLGPNPDMWDGGDNFIYLHDSNLVTGDFTATVRVVSQTEAIDGRWGKAGIRASNNLGGESANAIVQVAAGNGSQPGGSDPVPAVLAGRFVNNTASGFESPILGPGGVQVPNDVFRPDGSVNTTWLQLSYEESSNAFVAGIAPDVGGAPGMWNYSIPNPVQSSGNGWYVGLAYSAHDDMDFTQVTRLDGLHGVSFDNYSVVPVAIPEPSNVSLFVVLVLGTFGYKRLASFARRTKA